MADLSSELELRRATDLPRRRRRRVPGVKTPFSRATMRNAAALYPFQAEVGLGEAGMLLGTNYSAGADAFYWDSFALYPRLARSTNVVVAGEIGSGKTAFIKQFLYRTVGTLRSPDGSPRMAIVFDPKGEYDLLAAALGIPVIRLRPGGSTRINPLDPGPGVHGEDRRALTAARIDLVGALLSSKLRRPLEPTEESILGWTLAEVSETRAEPTLNDLADLWRDPSVNLRSKALLEPQAFIERTSDMWNVLNQMIEGSLAGMFDGRSTVHPDMSGRGMVIDLSAINLNDAAMPLVMLLATSWARQAFTERTRNRRTYQVVDEAWVAFRDPFSVRMLQESLKLSRHWGLSTILTVHKLGDFAAQADASSATGQIAAGVLNDCSTRILFSQVTDQLETLQSVLKLTEKEKRLLPQLVRGRALYRVGEHTAVVQHDVRPEELAFCDNDSRTAV